MRSPWILLALLLFSAQPLFAQDDPRVLITGFTPWGYRTNNPSWDGAAPLNGTTIEGHRVDARLIEVDYRKVFDALPGLLGEGSEPAVVVHFGVAGGPGIRFETQARNEGRWGRDDGGYAPEDNRITDDGPMIYASLLPQAEIVSGLEEAGYEVTTSDNPGLYLCEFTFYSSLYFREKLGQQSLAGFIHVPYFGQNWDAPRLTEAMRELIAIVLRKRAADEAAAQQASGGPVPVASTEDGAQGESAESETEPQPEAEGAERKPRRFGPPGRPGNHLRRRPQKEKDGAKDAQQEASAIQPGDAQGEGEGAKTGAGKDGLVGSLEGNKTEGNTTPKKNDGPR